MSLMLSAIHRFISPLASIKVLIERVYGCLPQESYKTALKVAASVACAFLLYNLKGLFFTTSKPSVSPISPVVPTVLPEEEEEEFWSFSDDEGEPVVPEKEQEKPVQKLEPIAAPLSLALKKLIELFRPYSYPCELLRQSGTKKVDFIDDFLQVAKIKSCTFDEDGRFIIAYDFKQDFTIFHLPDFAAEDFPEAMRPKVQSWVKENRPKAQVANPVSGKIVQQEAYLEVIFDEGAFRMPETGPSPYNYKAEIQSVRFTHNNKKDEPPTVLFCFAKHNSYVAWPFTRKGIELWPHYIARVMDMNAFPAEYGLTS